MALYYLQLRSNYILECGYVLENLLALHNSPIPSTSLNIRSYYHHTPHSCTLFYSRQLECHPSIT